MGFSILHLHWLGDGSTARLTSVRHAHFLARYAPAQRCWFHDLEDPITPELLRARFDAVVMDPTFLCARYLRPRAQFEAVVEKYRFLRERDAVKIAFPQDEYDGSEPLCAWLEEMRVDVVYTVLPEHRALLLPSLRCEVLPALTGYVDDDDLARGRPPPLSARPIDVGYRATSLPPQFGRHGQMKTRLGERFLQAAAAAAAADASASSASSSLRIDISTRPQDILLGEAWPRFLRDSRFTLGCEGGSSLHDPRGEIGDRVRAFLAAEPRASFEEVEAACFSGLDGQHVFSAISPRLFEVTLAGSAQALVPARYLGVLRAGEHYLPLAADASNAREVLDAVRDLPRAQRLADAAHAALIEDRRFRYSSFAAEVVEVIARHVEKKQPRADSPRTLQRLMRWHLAAARFARRYRRLRDRAVPYLPRAVIGPGMQLKRWLLSRR